jgi:hypothetical protein
MYVMRTAADPFVDFGNSHGRTSRERVRGGRSAGRNGAELAQAAMKPHSRPSVGSRVFVLIPPALLFVSILRIQQKP